MRKKEEGGRRGEGRGEEEQGKEKEKEGQENQRTDLDLLHEKNCKVN